MPVQGKRGGAHGQHRRGKECQQGNWQRRNTPQQTQPCCQPGLTAGKAKNTLCGRSQANTNEWTSNYLIARVLDLGAKVSRTGAISSSKNSNPIRMIIIRTITSIAISVVLSNVIPCVVGIVIVLAILRVASVDV